MVEKEYCPGCQRHVRDEHMTMHHYHPQSQGGTIHDTMRLCKCCHENLHYYISIYEVSNYNSIEKLEEHPEYNKYLNYIRNVQHDAMYTVKKLKAKLQKVA